MCENATTRNWTSRGLGEWWGSGMAEQRLECGDQSIYERTHDLRFGVGMSESSSVEEDSGVDSSSSSANDSDDASSSYDSDNSDPPNKRSYSRPERYLFKPTQQAQ
jgi:hypothetical protein